MDHDRGRDRPEHGDHDTVTIARTEYNALIADQETLEDVLAFDRAVGTPEEGLPHDAMRALLSGEAAPLAVFRQWRGLSQSELAGVSGVNRVQIADIEAGRATGSVTTLKKLADALNIGLDELAS